MSIRISQSKQGTTIRMTGKDAAGFFDRLRQSMEEATETIAYCWATGVIGFAATEPEGAITIASGPDKQVRELIAGTCRLAHDNKTWLVPGVPEAADQTAAVDALIAYRNWIRTRATDALKIAGGN